MTPRKDDEYVVSIHGLPPMKEPWQRLKDDIRKIIYDTEPGKVNLIGSDPQIALCTINGLQNAKKVQDSYDGRVWYERCLMAQIVQGERLIVGSRASTRHTTSMSYLPATQVDSPRCYPQLPVKPTFVYAESQPFMYSPIFRTRQSSEDSSISPTSLGCSPHLQRDDSLDTVQSRCFHARQASSGRPKISARGPICQACGSTSSSRSHKFPAEQDRVSQKRNRPSVGPIIADGTR